VTFTSASRSRRRVEGLLPYGGSAHYEYAAVQSYIGVAHGVRVTRSMRTILDVLAGGEVPLAILRRAVREGLRRGLMRRSKIAEARKQPADRKQSQTFLQKVTP
jgi:hypothetical protein